MLFLMSIIQKPSGSVKEQRESGNSSLQLTVSWGIMERGKEPRCSFKIALHPRKSERQQEVTEYENP